MESGKEWQEVRKRNERGREDIRKRRNYADYVKMRGRHGSVYKKNVETRRKGRRDGRKDVKKGWRKMSREKNG